MVLRAGIITPVVSAESTSHQGLGGSDLCLAFEMCSEYICFTQVNLAEF